MGKPTYDDVVPIREDGQRVEPLADVSEEQVYVDENSSCNAYGGPAKWALAQRVASAWRELSTDRVTVTAHACARALHREPGFLERMLSTYKTLRSHAASLEQNEERARRRGAGSSASTPAGERGLVRCMVSTRSDMRDE